MGHITVDRLDDAWKFLSKAERLLAEDQSHASVLYCEKAIDDVEKSADGMGFGVWVTKKTSDVRDKIGELKFESDPNEKVVEELIETCYGLIRECADKVIPELHSRIDYSPTPSRFDFEGSSN